MRRDVVPPVIHSSFLSVDKDSETILRRLFVTSGTWSEQLKRLLVINAPDCLDNLTSDVYNQKLKDMSLAKLIEEGYVRTKPKIRLYEHEEVKSYIYLSFDNFTPTKTNPKFRDCIVYFDVICHTDYWDIGDYRLRPFKIVGIIDGILNESRLSGLGTFQFLNCSMEVYDENLSGYCLSFAAVHGSDDWIPGE